MTQGQGQTTPSLAEKRHITNDPLCYYDDDFYELSNKIQGQLKTLWSRDERLDEQGLQRAKFR